MENSIAVQMNTVCTMTREFDLLSCEHRFAFDVLMKIHRLVSVVSVVVDWKFVSKINFVYHANKFHS